MKNLQLLSKVCLMTLAMVATSACTRDNDEVSGDYDEVSGDYVDLGLSSGTKWKTVNEKNAADAEYAFFTYDEAIATFGDKMPSREQWMELVNECSWTWTGMGYRVVGPNGKSISLPASGCRNCSGNVFDVGSLGYYWSSTPHGSEYAWLLNFSSYGVRVSDADRCSGRSVRLVQDK